MSHQYHEIKLMWVELAEQLKFLEDSRSKIQQLELSLEETPEESTIG